MCSFDAFAVMWAPDRFERGDVNVEQWVCFLTFEPCTSHPQLVFQRKNPREFQCLHLRNFCSMGRRLCSWTALQLYSIGVRVRSIHVSNGVENVSVRMFWSCNAQRCSGKDICDSNCSNTELNFLAPPPIEEFELPRQSVAIPELRSEFVFENGEKYTGEWIGNERHGTGSHLWPNGARYDGQFRNNQANGDGTFRFPNGGVYEGQWKSDRAHGHGSYRHFDQASYDGQWRNDKQHGEGCWTLAGWCTFWRATPWGAEKW